LRLIRSNITRWSLPTFAALTLVAAGCSKPGPSRTFTARVGSVELPREDVRRGEDSLGVPRERSRAYVEEWVVSELLYQEAQRRGLAETEDVRRQLDAARKRLAIEALLQKELFGASGPSVTDEEIEAWYRANTNVFVLKEDVIRADYALFAEREPANQFRGALLKGISWDRALETARNDSINARMLRATATGQYFTQSTLYPDELWKLARTLAKDEVSFVVRTPGGHYVLVVHGLRRAGELPEYAYVKDQVRERLLIDQRRNRFEKLVAALRSRQNVEVSYDADDSSASKE
jgi:hypothetical protein